MTMEYAKRRAMERKAQKILGAHSVKILGAEKLDVLEVPTELHGTMPKGVKGMTNQEFQAWSEWLTGQDWTFFTTFTTGYASSVKAARRLNQRYFESLKRHAPNGVRYFWVAEKHKHRGYHSHGLLSFSGLTSENSSEEITPAWRIVIDEYQRCAGKLDDYPFHRNKVAVFDNKKGASEYCIKYLKKDAHDWDFHVC